MNEEFLVVFCTVQDEITASNISKTLVENNLAACCNIISDVKSIYRWNGKITEDTEFLIIIKTKTSMYKEMQKSIIKWHCPHCGKTLNKGALFCGSCGKKFEIQR